MKHINVALFVVHKGCPHMCSFCNQRSITGLQKELTVEDIRKSAETALASLDRETAACGEIAFFGGSFTMIEHEYMISLLKAANEYIGPDGFKGIRISTRPDGISDEICRVLKKYNVTAVELGAQSLDDRVLELNERGHTSKQVEEACLQLKRYGFETGLQMMTGLYGSEDSDSVETARKIINLKPDTVRIYPTVVLKNTRLCELMEKGVFKPKSVEDTVPLCAELICMFENAGINVIRVGLHSGGGVDGEYVGGAYHPALRELCESRIYLEAAGKILAEREKGKYELTVGKGQKSKMIGQNRRNMEYLEKSGYLCSVAEDESIKKYEVKVRLLR